MNAKRTREKRDAFFEHFRRRLATASRKDLESPDRLVILSVCLDALAKHWSGTTGAELAWDNDADRMRLFLKHHGGHPAFDRVSVPLLRKLANVHKGPRVLPVDFPFGRYDDYTMNQVTTWAKDIPFAEIANLASPTNPDEKPLIPREVLVGCSYGGIIYKRLRCAWVHEFAPTHDDVMTPESDTISNHEPFYRYMAPPEVYIEGADPRVRRNRRLRGEFRLVLPVPFLIGTIDRALASFEAETTRLEVAPYRD